MKHILAATMEAHVRIGSRSVFVVLLGAALFASGAARVQAQEANGPGQPDTRAQRLTPEDSDAAARAQAEQLEGLGGEPDALLGAPAAPADPYGAAFDTTKRSERALTHIERVPRGALAAGRNEPRAGGKLKGAQPGMTATEATRNAKVDKADPGTRSPTESALSIYHGSADVGKAVGEVYKMPW